MEYFFTAGADEVKAWTIQVYHSIYLDIYVMRKYIILVLSVIILQKGTKAPQAAGRIHTDFEKGFIMAEVFKVADLQELGDENKVDNRQSVR